MVTTRHKAAVDKGEAPPQPRKKYTEIGSEEFEEEESEHDVEFGETSPKRGKKGKKRGAGAAAGQKKRGRSGAKGGQKKKGGRELQREDQSPPESEKEGEEAKRMRMAEEEGAPEPQQGEQPQLGEEDQDEEEMLLQPPEPAQVGEPAAVPEEGKKQAPQTQEEEKEEPTQAEEQEEGATPAAAVLETQQAAPEEEQKEEEKQMEEEAVPVEEAKQEEEAPIASVEPQEEEDKQQPEQEQPETVEQGRLLFFYRPKVGVEEASSLSEVQRFYMILAPETSGRKPRLAVLGKKRLPKVSGHERFFGFIEAVGDSVEVLTEGLGEKTYETKTRGTRHVAAARAVGEATYAIVNRGGSGAGAGKTHLVLNLIVPQQPGEVQEDFAIPKEGSYAFSLKNPMNAPKIGLEEKAEYTPEKKKEFGSYAWIGCTDPSLLEYERCEFLLVAATEDVQGELGAGAGELAGVESDEERLLEKLKKEINGGEQEEAGVEMQPIETGEWK